MTMVGIPQFFITIILHRILTHVRKNQLNFGVNDYISRSSDPHWIIAAMASSRSARVCSEIGVIRKRAVPAVTVGGRIAIAYTPRSNSRLVIANASAASADQQGKNRRFRAQKIKPGRLKVSAHIRCVIP